MSFIRQTRNSYRRKNSIGRHFPTLPSKIRSDQDLSRFFKIAQKDKVTKSPSVHAPSIHILIKQTMEQLSSSRPNVKVKSKLGPEVGFVMGWPTTTTHPPTTR